MADNYKQYKKAKKERNFYGNAQVVSSGIAGIGATSLGMSSYLSHQAKKAVKPTTEEVAKAAEKGKKLVSTNVSPELLKKGKILGGVGLAVGAAGLGYTTVKKQRAERRLKELSKDDNKKKN